MAATALKSLKGGGESEEVQYSGQPTQSLVVPKKIASGAQPITKAGQQAQDEIDIVHPASDLRRVMAEILASDKEQAFCFLNETQLRTRMAMFNEYFLNDLPERRITYAMKANPRSRILKILAEEGLDGFDCASIDEVRKALRFKLASGIYFNHPIKKSRDIREAMQYGVSYYTVQSSQGIDRVVDESANLDASSRLEMALRVATFNDQAEIDLSSKYGCLPQEAGDLLDQIRASGASPALAMHTGSQNKNVQTFCDGFEVLSQLAQKKGKMSSINLGGGLPINYFRYDHFDLKDYLTSISDAVRGNVHDTLVPNGEGRVIMEPGRSMVADSVDLAIPILEIDQRGGEKRVFIDDGIFTSFSDHVIHGWKYNYQIYRGDQSSLSKSKSPFHMYGRTCDSGDSLGRIQLPDNLQVGDFLWVKNAGAYMDSQASRFNGFEPPLYVSYNI
jgi:ornithine decarboxylase